MVNGNSHKMNTSDFCMYGGCWLTYIHKRPNIGNALKGLFTGTQAEKDGSNKARVLSHMSLGDISTKHTSLKKIKVLLFKINTYRKCNGVSCYSIPVDKRNLKIYLIFKIPICKEKRGRKSFMPTMLLAPTF